MKEKSSDTHKVDVLMVLSRHIGKEKAIGMGELYEMVFGETWENRINDTRKLRYIITDLRSDGVPICSVSDRNGGGYFLASAGSELENYLGRIRRRALSALSMEAKIRDVALPELLGQLRFEMEG